MPPIVPNNAAPCAAPRWSGQLDVKGLCQMPADKLNQLDAPWRQRHRRLWIFLIGAPYIIMAPMLLLMPLGRKIPDRLILVIGVVCLVLLAVYAAIGLVWAHRVYWSTRGKMRRED